MPNNDESLDLRQASRDVVQRNHGECTVARVWLDNILRVFQAEGTDTRHLSLFASEVGCAFHRAYGQPRPMDMRLATNIAMINATLDMSEMYSWKPIGVIYKNVLQMLEVQGFQGISNFDTVPLESPREVGGMRLPNGEDISHYTLFQATRHDRQSRAPAELSILANTAFLYSKTKNLQDILNQIPYEGPLYAPAMRAGVREYCISPSAIERNKFENLLHAVRAEQFKSFIQAPADVANGVFSKLYLPVYDMSIRALEWAVDAVSVDHDIPNRPLDYPVLNEREIIRRTFFLQKDTCDEDAVKTVELLAHGLYYACMNVRKPYRWQDLGISLAQKPAIQIQAHMDAIIAQRRLYEKHMTHLVAM
jgi:hypothetical protein